MTFIVPQCSHCKHFRPHDGLPACSAFPDIIPSDIITNQHDHREPYPGDHGIRYEPEEGARFTVQFAFKKEQWRAPKGSPYGGRWIDEPDTMKPPTGHPRIEEPIPPESAKVTAGSNAFLAQKGISVEGLKARIHELYARATPEQLERRNWYYKAHDLAQAIADEYKIPLWRAAGAMSATSPQTFWDDEFDYETGTSGLRTASGALSRKGEISNQALMIRAMAVALHPDFTNKPYTITEESAAEYVRVQKQKQAEAKAKAEAEGSEFRPGKIWSWTAYNGVDPAFEQGKSFVGTHRGEDLPADILYTLEKDYIRGLGTNIIKAIRIARGTDPDAVLGGGGKTRSFFNNIYEPDVSMDATVDVHMARALMNNLHLSDDELASLVGQGSRYQVFSTAMKQAAKELGLKPHELQAIVWYVWRDDPKNRWSERSKETRRREAREKKERERAQATA